VIRQPPKDGIVHVEVAEEIINEEEFKALVSHQGLAAARAAAKVVEPANGD
jgi:hypothetical protein